MERQQCDLLIRNATVWTVDSEHQTHSPGAVAITGGRVSAVGPEQEILTQWTPNKTIDAQGGIAHPGFVETHTHVSMHLTREAFPDASNSSGYFASLIGALNALTPEDEHTSGLLAATEMLRSGTTTFADAGTVMNPDAVSLAVESTGMRGLLGDPFVWDVQDYEWTSGMAAYACDGPSAIGRLGGQLWRNDSHGLVQGYLALWGLGTASDTLLRAAKDVADDAGVALTLHQSMEARDVERDRGRLGRSPLSHLESIGLLDRNVYLAHMNYLDSDDIEAMARSSASVAWVPGNFLYYSLPSVTLSPIPELGSRGVNISLGTDVAKAWGYSEQGLLGYLAARVGGQFLAAESLLDMATIGGARALMMSDRIGSIEPGKFADIVIRDPTAPELYPGVHAVRNVMLGLRSKGVRMVIVNGEIVLEDGRLTRVDEGEILESAAKRARDIACRIGR